MQMNRRPEFQTLHELFERSIHEFTERPLFMEKKEGAWQSLSYRAFGERVQQAARAMRAHGLQRGDRVAIISGNRVEWAVAAYASLESGVAFVPMYETQREKDWVYILADCGARMAFVASATIANQLVAHRDELPRLEKIAVFSADKDGTKHSWDTFIGEGDATYQSQTETDSAHATLPQPDDVASLIYTSGTTGKPKGVVLTHRNIASNVTDFQGIFEITPEDRSLSFLPWAHAFGQTAELHMLFSSGVCMALAEGVERIVANLAEVKPTLIISVPRIFHQIYDGVQKKLKESSPKKQALFQHGLRVAQAWRDAQRAGKKPPLSVRLQYKALEKVLFGEIREKLGGRMRFAVSGGAALSLEVARFVDALGVVVYEGYGMTEASPVIAVNTYQAFKMGSVGKPLRSMEVRVDRTVVDGETRNEIVVRGPNVMRGYHNLPEETAAVLEDDQWLHTGDMGHLDDEGFLFITGRLKEKYKLQNGKYVVPTVLEDVLRLSPYVKSAFVWGDNQVFNCALIVVDRPALESWSKRELPPVDASRLLTGEQVQRLFEAEIKRCMGDCKSYERVKKFALIEEDFSVDQGTLTPSLKIKRRAVLSRYGKLLEELYH